MVRIESPQVWEHFVGSQSREEFLGLMDEEIAQGKYPDRKAGFLAYANFALTNLCVRALNQVPYDGGWGVESLAAELQRQAEEGGV